MPTHLRAIVIGLLGPALQAVGVAWDLLEHGGSPKAKSVTSRSSTSSAAPHTSSWRPVSPSQSFAFPLLSRSPSRVPMKSRTHVLTNRPSLLNSPERRRH
jgi:hypothetical protein